MKKTSMILSAMLLLLAFNVFSKSTCELTNYFKNSDIRFCVQNAGIGMPPHFVNGRLHLGFEVGIIHDLKVKHKKSYLNYNLIAGYFAQQSLQRNLYLKPGIGYSIALYKQIRIRPLVNLALMGVQQINKEFKLNAQGEYKQANRNRFQFMPSLGLELLIPTAQGKNYSCQTLLAYHFGVQLPFSSISSILPINQIQIGFQIKRKNNFMKLLQSKNLIMLIVAITFISSCKKRASDEAVLTCNENFGWVDSSNSHPKNAILTNMINELTAQGIPGVSLMVEDNDGIWFKSSGYADLGIKTKMQPCHLGKIASVTKLFTATMIYKLIDAGKLNLDDPISNFIDKSIIDKIKNSEKAKVRNLLAHSSGIYDVVFDPEFILYTFNNLDKEKSYEKLLSFAYGKKPDFEFNTKRSYNQTLNHVLLAMIVNKVTGQDQSEMLHNEILNPLGMTSTYIRPQDNIPWNQVAKGYYDYRKEGVLQDLTPLYTGDGKGFTGIYTNVNDLRKFMNALFKSQTLISNSSFSSMTEIPTLDSTLACAGGCRAMKINVNATDYIWFGHPGGEVNYAAGAFYCPQKNATITYTINYGVAFTDLGAYTDLYYEFRKRLFEEVSK